MARVFISYRRADGQYAVGWIEERLRLITGDRDITTAFRDSDLRYGEDFPARLAREVVACDVLIAVIGPNWHGAADDRPARILDPADWVGREITSALRDPDKLIVPVLLSGVEPPRADDLLPEHRGFADLHALRFDVREDLEKLARQIEDHLRALDTARTHLDGLDLPLPSTEWRPSRRTVGLAIVAALFAALIAWVGKVQIEEAPNEAWACLSAAQSAYWAAAFVVGLEFARHLLSYEVAVKWKMAVRAAVAALVLIGITLTSYAPGETTQVIVTLVEPVAAVALLSPWIFALIGAGWSTTAATAIRSRAIVLATQRRALAIATTVLAVALSLSVVTTSTIVDEPDAWEFAVKMIGYGIFLTMIVVGGVEYGHSPMRRDSELLRSEVADLSNTARRNVDPVLIEGRNDLWPRILLTASLPIAFAVVSTIVVVNT